MDNDELAKLISGAYIDVRDAIEEQKIIAKLRRITEELENSNKRLQKKLDNLDYQKIKV